MKTIAALVAAFPLLASAQAAPPPQPPQGWTTEPPPAAQPAPAQPTDAAPPAAQPTQAAPPAAQPTQAAPAPAQGTYPPPPQYAPPPPYAPPPQYAPPQYAPQPPRSYAARPLKTRDHWYIGFGFGGGDGKVRQNGDAISFTDLHHGGPTNVFMNFKAGGTLSPKLLLGGDITGMFSVADKDGVSTGFGVMNIDAMVTFFPMEKGLFLRGGTGLSSMSYTWDDSYGNEDLTASGFNLTGGVGYAFWIGQHFNLTANLDFSRQWFGTNEGSLRDVYGLEIKDAQYWAFWLGFDWY